jgi:hypothetical protein
MGPDGKCSLPRSLSVEIVARVLDYETKICVTCEVDGKLDLCDGRYVYNIHGAGALQARGGIILARGHASAAFMEVGSTMLEDGSARYSRHGRRWGAYWRFDLSQLGVMVVQRSASYSGHEG